MFIAIAMGEQMTGETWALRRNDRLVGTLVLQEQDMFWSDCRFAPGPGWESVRPLFDALRDAWVSGDREDRVRADDAILAEGMVLAPIDGGPPLVGRLLRIDGDHARFR